MILITGMLQPNSHFLILLSGTKVNPSNFFWLSDEIFPSLLSDPSDKVTLSLVNIVSTMLVSVFPF